MKTIKRTMLLAGAAAMMGFVTPVLAATPPAASAPTFGVVDMNRVMQTTDAAKDIFSQLEGKRKEYQAQIAKEETTLRSAEQSIVKQKDTLSKEEFEKKKMQFEEKVIQGQKMVQNRKRILDQAFNSAMGKLRQEAAKVVATAAREKNYSAVFTQDAVMISDPTLDMTAAVIERMNGSVKKINVDWAAADTAAQGGAPAETGNKK
jgi:Skp family chaperone for outer membrane proteins